MFFTKVCYIHVSKSCTEHQANENFVEQPWKPQYYVHLQFPLDWQSFYPYELVWVPHLKWQVSFYLNTWLLIDAPSRSAPKWVAPRPKTAPRREHTPTRIGRLPNLPATLRGRSATVDPSLCFEIGPCRMQSRGFLCFHGVFEDSKQIHFDCK